MKVIDQTPLQNEQGQIGIVQRIQGTLKYGLSWYSELQAQKFALSRLERGLAKGYVAVRNPVLGASGIIVPLALVGPAGIFSIYATNLHGQYMARGDSWSKLSGNDYKPLAVNLLTRTERMARALQAYIERQQVNLPQPVTPILFAVNPGMHVQSTRPLVRVVMADAIERWAASLGNEPPVLTVETAYELADRIVTPRKPQKEAGPDREGADPAPAVPVDVEPGEAQPIVPENLEFAFEGEVELGDNFGTEPSPPVAARSNRILGMTVQQLALLGGLALVEICVLLGFAIIIFQNI